MAGGLPSLGKRLAVGIAIIALALAGIAGAAEPAPATDEFVVVLPVKNAATHALLRGLLKDSDPIRRGEAIVALGRIGDAADAAAIRARLADDDPGVRALALNALAQLGTSAEDGILEKLAGDSDSAVRAALYASAPRAFFERRPDIVERGLQDSSPLARAAAADRADILAWTPEVAVRRLEAEPDSGVRARLVRARARRTDEARAPLLRAALESADAAARQAAFDSLTAEDAATFGAMAVEALGRERGAAAAAAIAAAARLKPAGAAAALARRLAAETDPMLWPILCEALGAFDGDAVALDALAAEIRRRRSFFAQAAAVRALGGFRALSPAAALVEAARDADPRLRARAAEQLGGVGGAEAETALWALLDDDEPSVLVAAMDALRRCGAKADAARPARVRALDGRADPDVTAAAIRLRGALGDRDAIPSLVQRLRRIGGDDPPAPRAAALEALIALGHGAETARAAEIATKKVLPPTALTPERRTDHLHVRRAALRYLERFGGAAEAEILLRGFEELPESGLRPDLARALTKLAGRPYRALPDYRYVTHAVESLDAPSQPAAPPLPGVAAE